MRAKWGPFYMIWHAWKHKWSHGHDTLEFNGAYNSVQMRPKKVCQGHMAITWSFLACSGSVLGQSKGKGCPKKSV